MPSPPEQLSVVIAGGGVAAFETALALHDLAGSRAGITLVAPEREFVYRPLSVGEPFGVSAALVHPLADLARDIEGRLVSDCLVEVHPVEHRVDLAGGRDLGYDVLVLAVGAVPRIVERESVTFVGSETTEAIKTILADLRAGQIRHIAFVVPAGITWPLPLYEIAAMTAQETRSLGIDNARIWLVTPEREPLVAFGDEVSHVVAELLERSGVTFFGSTPAAIGTGVVRLDGGRRLRVDRVVALPVLHGPRISGVPCDADGFLPVDGRGRVTGVLDVYAAGDCTTYPVKQGGLATQQADSVASAVAAEAGADVEPELFRPVLRGMLLTDGFVLSMQRELTRPDTGRADAQSLRWPPVKIAGRHLAPYLHGREETELLGEQPSAAHVRIEHALGFPDPGDSAPGEGEQ